MDWIFTATEQELISFLEKASNAYYNTDKPIISDNDFDYIYDYFKKTFPKSKFLSKIGSVVKDAVALPYWLGSMNKVKTDKDLKKWLKLNINDNYICTDKLDGASALYYKNKLYTRGDGKYGKDISFLLPYLNLPKTDYAIRGELVISKKKYKNSRNIVVGVLNSKKKAIDEIAKEIKFISYEIIANTPTQPTQSQQLYLLKKSGFMIPYFESLLKTDITEKKLTNSLFERKANNEYDIDGIIITPNHSYTRNESGNPDYAVAFKVNVDEYTTTVLVIEWVVSKDGYIIPTVKFEPVDINGAIISSAQGFNAKYILDNSIGPGSKIKIVRSGDVIPYIVGVIKSTEPNLPHMNYKWNKNKVHFLIDEESSTLTLKKELTHFVKTIGVKHFDEKLVEKLINANINSVNKIINLKKEDLLKIDGFKDTLASKLVSQITTCMNNIDLITLMVASNSWGHGFSFKKFKLVLDKFPNILKESISFDDINSIQGYSNITSEQFIEGLNNFKNFLKKNKIKIPESKEIKKTNKYKNLIFVFSGFRDKQLEETIVEGGGIINNTVSKKTNYVIVKDLKSTSSKVERAKELNIEIITIDKFFLI